MKRIISAILLIGMLSSLAACGVTKTPPSIETSPDETANLAESYVIKMQDFGGEDICIITGEHAEYEYMIEEETGDVVNDAIFTRNREVKELLNIHFSFVSSPNYKQEDEFYTLIRNDIMAGDKTYDIINGLNVFTTPMMFDGLF